MLQAGHSPWIIFVPLFSTSHSFPCVEYIVSFSDSNRINTSRRPRQKAGNCGPHFSLSLFSSAPASLTTCPDVSPSDPIRSDPIRAYHLISSLSLSSFRLCIASSRRRIATAVGITTHARRPPSARFVRTRFRDADRA